MKTGIKYGQGKGQEKGKKGKQVNTKLQKVYMNATVDGKQRMKRITKKKKRRM